MTRTPTLARAPSLRGPGAAAMRSEARERLKQSLIESEVRTQRELARRRLDFEVIRDNHRNKATKEILEKFTGNVGAKGQPGAP